MPRRLLFLLCAGLICLLAAPGAAVASSDCARASGGKCKVGQTEPSNTLGVVTYKAAQPPARSTHKGREAYTPAQREKIMEKARALCRKTYGAPSRVNHIDYRRNTVWCEDPTY